MAERRPESYPQSASEVAAASREIAGEIETSVRHLLPRLGVSGSIVVRGTQIELHTSGAPVSVDIAWVVEQWAVLPADMRERKAVEVSRRLVEAHRRASGASTAPAREGSGAWQRPAIIAGVVLAIAGGGYAATQLGGAGEETAAAVTPPVDDATAAKGRAEKSCEAGRKNAYTRRSIDQFGTEGWVAELWLASRGDADPAQSEVVKALLADGKLAASADEALGAIRGGTLEIAKGFAPGDAALAAGWKASILRFGGEYARVFLVDPAMRARFVSLSERVATGSASDLAALYGRCAHLPYRDIGAWFHGKDRAGAAAALVYGVGAYTEAPSLDRNKIAKVGTTSDLDGLIKAIGAIDEGTMATLVGAPGGSVTKGAGPVSIGFPLLGGTGATTASASLAEKAGIGIAAQ